MQDDSRQSGFASQAAAAGEERGAVVARQETWDPPVKKKFSRFNFNPHDTLASCCESQAKEEEGMDEIR